MRYGMMIELDKCVGCLACVSACKERWDSGPGAARDWVREYEHGTREQGLSLTFYPGLCMQCEDHPCTIDCPTGATYADENGVVVVNSEICIGCGNCVPMCPYSARTPDSKKKIVEKCNLCAPYVAAGGQPACVQTCLAECRHFGDLDDPNGDLVKRITQRDAKTLVTNDINVGPKVYYAPADKREAVLAQGVIREPVSTWVTQVWQKATRPAAQWGVPALAAFTAVGGAMVNFRARGLVEKAKSKAEHDGEKYEPLETMTEKLKRHTAGMRFLHWFNAASWIILLISGTALMSAPSFALFGPQIPKMVAGTVGGQPKLLLLHILWGLLWSVLIVPTFIYLKKGGIEALHEIWPTKDDIRWMMVKPLVMLGIGNAKLPPQDKYNAGQKGFAVSALAGTTLIIGSGLVMTFHLGSAEVVAAAILVHKLAIGLALVGIAVHITMAAIIKEERPALRSMLTGYVDRSHAAHHSEKWVEQVDKEQGKSVRPTAGEGES